MKRSTTSIRISLALSVGVPLALLWLLSNGTILTTAAPDSQPLRAPDEVITVCLAGQCRFASIQDAVDAAGSGDIVKVAQGTYTDIHARAGVTQVVYISKTVTIQGGYTTTNWTTPYPITQPTTLDAHGQGRVLYIAGNITPTIEGLHITGGNAIGLLGNPWGTRDVGSGIYVTHATPYISNNQVFSNTAANQGGGLYLSFSDATLTGNTIFGNNATHAGGGLYLYQSDNASLIGNTISANTAADYGGGLYLRNSDATLSENSVFSNAAPSGGGLYLYGGDNAIIIGNTISNNNAAEGGGVYLAFSNAALSGNTVAANWAGMAGGLRLWSSDATLNCNTIISNTASGTGGGLHLGQSNAMLNRNTIANNAASRAGGLCLAVSNATLTNNLVADNRASSQGSGLYIERASPRFLHNTVAHNMGGDGSGIYITDNGSDYSNVALTNTILVNHTVGIFVTVGNTATLDSTLWHANTTDRSGNVVHAQDHSGTPAFDADGYHLTADSAAIDEGVDTGIAVDIDGELRPAGTGYDIGADEFHPEPDISITGLSASNSSPTMFGQPTTLTATIVTGSNVVFTWTVGDGHSANGAVVTHIYPNTGVYTAVVTATNSVSVVTTTTTVTITPIIYLPLTMRRWPPVPYAPTLNAINNTDGDGDYTVSWTEQPSRLAETYTLQEATNATFTAGLRDVCTTPSQFCTVSDNPAGTYYYRVRGHNTWGYSAWSNVQTTTVGPTPYNLSAQDIVLQMSDMPPGYALDEEDSGPVDLSDALLQMGAVEGYEVTYTNFDLFFTGTPLVYNLAVVFRTTGGARSHIQLVRQNIENDPDATFISCPTFGDETVAGKIVAQDDPYVAYAIAFRKGNLTSSIGTGGFSGIAKFDDAISFARKARDRINDQIGADVQATGNEGKRSLATVEPVQSWMSANIGQRIKKLRSVLWTSENWTRIEEGAAYSSNHPNGRNPNEPCFDLYPDLLCTVSACARDREEPSSLDNQPRQQEH